MKELWTRVQSFATSLGLTEWVSLAITVLVGIVLTAIARRVLPSLFKRAFERVDAAIPAADLSALAAPIARVFVWLAFALIAFATVLVALTVVGVETGVVTSAVGAIAADATIAALPVLVRLAALVAITLIALRIIRATVPRAMARALRRRERAGNPNSLESDKRRTTLTGVVTSVLGGVTVVIASFVALGELGFDIGPILAGAGVVGLAVGFGAQHMVRDYLAGGFILFEDHYRVGDIVEIAGKIGMVEELELRRTLLRDLDKTLHIVPNGIIDTASNFSKEMSQLHVNVPVAYKEDLDQVIELIGQVGAEMYEERACDGALREPVYVRRVDAFADNGVLVKALGLTEPGAHFDCAGEFRRRIKRAFDERGIEIPVPQRVVRTVAAE